MDNALTKTLAEALQAIESGADLDVVVARYPAQAEALMSHLGLWSRLNAAPRAEIDPLIASAGKARMMTGLAAPAVSSPLPTAALAKAIAVAAGIVVLGASATGASAALGGPDFAGSAFESVGISRGGGSSSSTGSDGSDISTDTLDGSTEDGAAGDTVNPNPNENANPNAFEGCQNRDDGSEMPMRPQATAWRAPILAPSTAGRGPAGIAKRRTMASRRRRRRSPGRDRRKIRSKTPNRRLRRWGTMMFHPARADRVPRNSRRGN